MDSHEPPFLKTYKSFLEEEDETANSCNVIEDCDLPLIDFGCLTSDDDHDKQRREKCMHEIIHAATNWGFFQIVNHGISKEILKSMENEKRSLFSERFENKIRNRFLNFSPNSYRWGNAKATCLKQLSWSEAFHLSITDISAMEDRNNLRFAMDTFATVASGIAKTLAKVLSENMGSMEHTYFQENCPPSACFLRMNRYPPCPYASSKLVFGLIPHTDTDFISVVRQDQIGGLQLLRDGTWFGVKPNPEALLINIGDLFQAISNGLYKSVKHRVVATEMERYSCAYFYCPSNDAIVESFGSSPPIYRKFSFREYKEQTTKDVQHIGQKVGLPRFLLQ